MSSKTRERAALDKLNMVALERVSTNRFRIPPNPPLWLAHACSEGDEEEGIVTFNDPLSFVANFLVDAEESWSKSKPERVASGVYTVRRPKTPKLHVEFFADTLVDSPTLFVELSGLGAPNAEHQAVRAARRSKLQLERLRAERHSEQSERRDHDAFLKTLPVLYLKVDHRGIVLDAQANGEYARDGRSRSDIGKTLFDLFGSECGSTFLDHVQFVTVNRKSGAFSFQDFALGRARHHQVELNPLDKGQVVVVVRDVTDQVHLERHLKSLAFKDSLTGLPNRNLLEDRIIQATRRANRSGGTVGIFFVDLDGFKQVNDEYGHAVGDKVLVTAAGRLTKAVRTSDTVIRLGGDEFLIVVEGASQTSDYEIVATKIITVLKEAFTVDSQPVKLSASIGVACYPHDGLTAERLVRRADKAMYQAKEAGKNCLAYAAADTTSNIGDSRQAYLNALDKEQLDVAFVPIIDSDNKSVVALKAVPSWHPPSNERRDFLTTAKALGLRYRFDRQTFILACQAFAHWKASLDFNYRLSFEISEDWLRQSTFVGDLQDICSVSNIRSQEIELEFPEEIADRSITELEKRAVTLRSLGFRIAITRFGSGNSSILQLQRFPVDTIKIDSKYIQQADQSEGDRQLCAIVSDLARTLGVRLVAEGVSTQRQHTTLLAIGYRYFQGPLFSTAVARSQLVEWVRAWSAEHA